MTLRTTSTRAKEELNRMLAEDELQGGGAAGVRQQAGLAQRHEGAGGD